MSGSLSMTLDDMVKRSKIERSGGRGRFSRGRVSNRFSGGGRGIGGIRGGARRGPLAVNVRQSSFLVNKPVHRIRSLPWQKDLFEESLRSAGIPGVEDGTRVQVSNLDQGVTNEDIRELFSEIGELKRYAIHFDKNGRPSGSAEVVYLRRSDAFQALKRYDNVLLDGKPIRLEVVGANTEAPVSARVNVTGRNRRTVVLTQLGGGGRGRGGPLVRGPVARGPAQNRRGGMRNTFGAARGGGRGGGHGGGRGGGRGGARGGGRGRGSAGGRGKKPVEKSAADLDMELDSYHAEAKN